MQGHLLSLQCKHQLTKLIARRPSPAVPCGLGAGRTPTPRSSPSAGGQAEAPHNGYIVSFPSLSGKESARLQIPIFFFPKRAGAAHTRLIKGLSAPKWQVTASRDTGVRRARVIQGAGPQRQWWECTGVSVHTRGARTPAASVCPLVPAPTPGAPPGPQTLIGKRGRPACTFLRESEESTEAKSVQKWLRQRQKH